MAKSSVIDCKSAHTMLKELTHSDRKSVFTNRTDKDSATQYFQVFVYSPVLQQLYFFIFQV